MSRNILEAFPILDWRGGVFFTWRRPFRARNLFLAFELPGLVGDFGGVEFESSDHYNGLASGLCESVDELFGSFILGRLRKDGLLHGLKPWEIRKLICSLELIYDDELGLYSCSPL